MTSWAQLKAAYGLLRHPKVSHARLSQPHWEATRAAMAQAEVVLLVQDSSELDYTPYAQTLAGLDRLVTDAGAACCSTRCWPCCRSSTPCASTW